MAIETRTIASELGQRSLRSKENISIVCASRDNRSFCINVISSDPAGYDGYMPNSVILSEKPLDNFKIISRIVSDDVYCKEIFLTKCRVIANSIEDKLKSYAILKDLRNCL